MAASAHSHATASLLFRVRMCSLAAVLICESSFADTWRVGDRDQPWRPHPVSRVFDVGPSFRPDYVWGGGFAVEVAVDDDGDGLIDEDPVNPRRSGRRVRSVATEIGPLEVRRPGRAAASWPGRSALKIDCS